MKKSTEKTLIEVPMSYVDHMIETLAADRAIAYRMLSIISKTQQEIEKKTVQALDEVMFDHVPASGQQTGARKARRKPAKRTAAKAKAKRRSK